MQQPVTTTKESDDVKMGRELRKPIRESNQEWSRYNLINARGHCSYVDKSQNESTRCGNCDGRHHDTNTPI